MGRRDRTIEYVHDFVGGLIIIFENLGHLNNVECDFNVVILNLLLYICTKIFFLANCLHQYDVSGKQEFRIMIG